MGIEEILQSLEEEGKAACEDVLNRAREQAKQIREEAQEEAEKLRQSEIEKARVVFESEAAKIVNAARLAAKKEVIKAKEEAVKEVVEEALKEIRKLRKDKKYPEVFRHLLEEALEGVSGKVVVRVNPDDVKMAEKLLTELQVDGEVKEIPAISGGVIVDDAEGSVTITNTLESRLKKAAQVYKAEVTRIIFPEI